MPHTRRARELGLCRITVGDWDHPNDRFKLRLCWAEQCVALCVGEDGMTEVRVSLSQIHLQDLGDGRIEVNLVPGFARKFYGHTAHHYNALREVQKDPFGGVLDQERKAICHVRGGDPVKLATDFVVRVNRFRVEVKKPEPVILPNNIQKECQKITPQSTPVTAAVAPTSRPMPTPVPLPLASKSTNTAVWPRIKNGIPPPIKGSLTIGNNGIGTFNIPKPTFQSPRDALGPNFIQISEKTWLPNSVRMQQQRDFGTRENPKPIQRMDENNNPLATRMPHPMFSFYKGGQSQEIKYTPNQSFLSKESREILAQRPEFTPNRMDTNINTVQSNGGPNPAMASLLAGSIPEPDLNQELSYLDHGPVMATPSKKRWDKKDKKLQSILTPTSGMNGGMSYQTPIRAYYPNATMTYPNTPNSFSSGHTTSSPITSLSDVSVSSNGGFNRYSGPQFSTFKTQFGLYPPPPTPNHKGMTNGDGVTLNMSEGSSAESPSAPNLGVVLMHICPEHMDGVAVRPAPVWASLAELAVLAAYFWLIPLEEVRLYGRFQGEKVVLQDEKDWHGYFDVCSLESRRCIIEVHREFMGGINKCDPNVHPKCIWGPMTPHTPTTPSSFSLGGISAKLPAIGNSSNTANGFFHNTNRQFSTVPPIGEFKASGSQ